MIDRTPMVMRSSRRVVVLLLGLLLLGGAVQAQVGGAYDLTRNSFDGGGATFSAGGVYQLGGTVGQPDAGVLSNGPYTLAGGFWGVVQVVPATPTPSFTFTATPPFTPTPTSSRTPTATISLTATEAPTGSLPTISPTAKPSSTPSPTEATPQPSASATATMATETCTGDCGFDKEVTVDEVLTMVNIALGNAPVATCDAGNPSGDETITVDEILQAVNNALAGCT